MLKGLLTRDAIERRTRKWRLMSEEEMQKILEKSNCKKPTLEDVYFRIGWFADPLPSLWTEIEKNGIALIQDNFIHLKDLLDTFKGSLVLAGGSVYKACVGSSGLGDADIFFVDPNVESNPNIPKYTQLLEEAVSFIIEKYISIPEYTVYLTRNEFVTTVYCEGVWEPNVYDRDFPQDQKYQFVHRVYPNIASILGGFDIGTCMLAYTGEKIVATELGAWSFSNRAIIVDTTRRSTSYEHRLLKHGKYANLIFPGLESKILAAPSIPSKKEMCLVMETFLEERNISIRPCSNTEGWIFCKGPDLNKKKEELEKEINELAYSRGFSVYNIRLSYTGENEEKETDKDFNSEIKKSMESIARSNGYHIDVNFFADCKGKWSRRPEEAFHELTRKLRLPYMTISLSGIYSFVEESRSKEGTPKYIRKISDYGDNECWYSMAPLSNITSLSQGGHHLRNVMSIIGFRNPRIPFKSVRRPQDGYHNHLDIIKSVHEVTTREEIQSIVRNSITRPYLGELKMAFGMRYDWFLRNTGENAYKRKRWAQRLFAADEEQDVGLTMERILKNAEEVEKNLSGVKWIVTNPGRQWTSSINPIMADPREWYGPFYKSFRIGCEGVETTLRLLRLRKDSPFYGMDKNVLNNIIRLVVWDNSYLM